MTDTDILNWVQTNLDAIDQRQVAGVVIILHSGQSYGALDLRSAVLAAVADGH